MVWKTGSYETKLQISFARFEANSIGLFRQVRLIRIEIKELFHVGLSKTEYCTKRSIADSQKHDANTIFVISLEKAQRTGQQVFETANKSVEDRTPRCTHIFRCLVVSRTPEHI